MRRGTRAGTTCRGVRALTAIEMTLVVSVIAILSLVGAVGVRGISNQARDAAAQASARQVMLAQWEHVSRTGSFASVDDGLDVPSPVQVTAQASTASDLVSMLLLDGQLRIAVLSDSGSCLTWRYPDPSAGTEPVTGFLSGQCTAVAVP